MKEKAVKGNRVLVFLLFVLAFCLAIGQGHVERTNIRIIMILVSFVCFVGFVIALIVLIGRLHFNRTLCKLPYDFDYEAEFVVYRNIGKTKKERAVKKLKEGYTTPDVYTAWECELKERNKKVMKNENNINFYHYLKRCLRNAKRFYDGMVVVLIPIEVGIMTVFLTNNGEQSGGTITLAVTAAVLAVILTKELYKSRSESEFVSDVIDILCPEFSADKDK